MASNAEDLLSCAICLEHFQVSDFNSHSDLGADPEVLMCVR